MSLHRTMHLIRRFKRQCFLTSGTNVCNDPSLYYLVFHLIFIRSFVTQRQGDSTMLSQQEIEKAHGDILKL